MREKESFLNEVKLEFFSSAWLRQKTLIAIKYVFLNSDVVQLEEKINS